MKLPVQPQFVERRVSGESVRDYYLRNKRVTDPETGQTFVKIHSGDCYVTAEPNEVLVTILGSCIAVCVRDPVAQVGGMNHFLLPGDEKGTGLTSAGARYGVNAMEQLINAVLKAGGRKDRLEIKVFGGGNVIRTSSPIGTKNAVFIREFLFREGFRITAQDLEGELPRRIHYYPTTGKVMLRKLRRREDLLVAEEEKRTQMQLKQTIEGDIDLFEGGL